ncbi:glycosyltransferase family 4 protein [Campylobacter curvus]|uniref:glycosyltransferase family 4 protein n=1 Tax=Campylobacter curvus TaxID=200 RepID=UPI00036AFEDD|nr:glycosyltransferase family 1 protein [Campylobacter curvus]QKF61459.1 glycosyltransferase, family 4 [Campylobacter curvus]UEB49768.1 glycosyltransferase family 4 protein [Campylobacter curvus]
MKIVVDFRMHNFSGIGTYIKNIIPFLVDEFEILLLGNKNEIEKYGWAKKVKIIECGAKVYSIKEQLELFLKVPKCDIFWSPHYNIPVLPIRAKKRVVTIHDVFHLAFIDTLSLPKQIYARFMIKAATKKSDRILSVSNFASKEIEEYTKICKQIYIVYNAIDINKFKVIKERQNLNYIFKKYNLPQDFILFVGNVKPNKNIKNLLLALKNIDENLVIVGKRDGFLTQDGGIDEILKDQNLVKKVYFTGFVDDEDIAFIYNLAKIFVFPSFYEGFGLPPLEAQACGCPVLCSNAASLPEVCVDSVVYFDPYNVDDIAKNIENLMSDEKMQNELRQKGFENIKRFSWQKSAEKIIKIFKEMEAK